MFGYLCGSVGAYECCAHSCLEIVSGPLELNLKAIVKCPMWIPDLFLISELRIQPQMQNKFENNPEKQKNKKMMNLFAEREMWKEVLSAEENKAMWKVEM